MAFSRRNKIYCQQIKVFVFSGTYQKKFDKKVYNIVFKLFIGFFIIGADKKYHLILLLKKMWYYYNIFNYFLYSKSLILLDENDENYKYSLQYFENSVKKYEGFYIGRFEVGKDGSNIVIQQNKVTYTKMVRDKALEDA